MENLRHYDRGKTLCDFMLFDSKSLDVSFVNSKRIIFAKKFCKGGHKIFVYDTKCSFMDIVNMANIQTNGQ